MTNPVYKIETYTGAVLDHTIEHDAQSIYFKEVLTDGVGQFRFVVPTKKNGGYDYDDIALNDKIKIYLAYDSVGVTPNFVGKVTQISAPLNTTSGYARHISGLSQGEVLLRRFKTNKFYDAIGASTIVTELADELIAGDCLGGKAIEADATAETHEVRTKRYFDLLKEISDYWFNAGTQVKKDFFVNVDNDLVWASRDGTAPFRTTPDVEIFTVEDNIISYNVSRSVHAVKNDITVYGQAEAPYPRDKDAWTEDDDSLWSASVGTVAKDNTGTIKVGSWKITADSGAGSICTFKLNMPRITIRDITTLYYWVWSASVPAHSGTIRLFAPDSSNYFYADSPPTGTWVWKEFTLGPKNEYDVATNPNGVWSKQGSPNWWDIEEIQWHYTWGATNQLVWIDGLYFFPERWSGIATDSGVGSSQEKYGQRDAEFTYDKLHSDAEAEKRAKTLLYQLKDPVIQIELATVGNTNVLVGDRLSMTIPAEGITDAEYDVISVEQFLSMEGFLTNVVMVNSANTRQPIETDPTKLLSNLTRRVSQLSEDMKLMK